MTGVQLTGLRGLGISSHYRSDQGDVLRQLYLPALSAAAEYSRAVGYFTSTSLDAVADGLDRFAARGGRMRLVASPRLTQEDVDDIQRGYRLREVLERATLRSLQDDGSGEQSLGLGRLGRLVAQDQLEIKLAYVQRGSQIGIYHEKIGFFRDVRGDVVAMSGSANETYQGLLENFESVEVFRSWLPGDDARASRIVQDFESLWGDATENLRVIDFPEAARQRLLEIGRQDRVSRPSRAERQLRVFGPPAGLEPRPYQREAVVEWLKSRGRGTLRMATGTGKTKTALFAASQIARVSRETEKPLVLLVVAPYLHLVDQWLEEIAEFGARGVGIYESSDRWLPIVEEQLASARAGRRDIVALAATTASFSLAHFQALLGRVDMPLLLIADESHNLGTKRFLSLLPPNATYRMALSATPERWFDDTGTAQLFDYFGPVVYELGLGHAIEIGALCRYRYFPRIVELDQGETLLYASLTQAIGQLLAEDSEPDDDSSPLGALLRKRSGVLGHASGKVLLFEQDVRKRLDAWFQLVYCAEGTRPLAEGYEEGPTQLQTVTRLLGAELHQRVHPYVADTDRSLRRTLLKRFGTGQDLKFLTAMRCLDEGVDIPDARVAYLLASSSNPRQFIQRRGRILRRAPGKDHADILDYIAVPMPADMTDTKGERALMNRELTRAAEFGRLSDNYEESLRVLRPLKHRYDLLDL